MQLRLSHGFTSCGPTEGQQMGVLITQFHLTIPSDCFYKNAIADEITSAESDAVPTKGKANMQWS